MMSEKENLFPGSLLRIVVITLRVMEKAGRKTRGGEN
jgi:hypothetical protein